MTKEEFLSIKRHSRIKYIGMDAAVLDQIKQRGSTVANTKGMVVDRVVDYTGSGWNEENKLTLITWNSGRFVKCKPEDWILADAKRIDLVRSREKRQASAARIYVKRELDRVGNTIRGLKTVKDRVDRWLDGLPLSAKMSILTGLDNEQKAWLQLVSQNPEEIINVLKKFADDPEESTDASNGSTIHPPAQTAVHTSELPAV